MANVLSIVGNPLVPVQGGRAIALAAAVAAKAFTVKNLVVRLYSNDIPLTQDTVKVDLVECIFSGYAEIDLVNISLADSPNGVPMLYDLNEALFTGADPLTIPDTAVGYFLVDKDNTALIAVERFVDSFPVDQAGDTLSIAVRLFFPGWGPVVGPG